MPFFFVYNHIPKIIIPDVASNGIFELFKKEGIEIPFPQRDLNIKDSSNFDIKKRVSVKKGHTK